MDILKPRYPFFIRAVENARVIAELFAGMVNGMVLFLVRPAKGAIHRGWESLPVRSSEPPFSRLGLCSSAQLKATGM